ncbi:unnamed protein product [Pleuronectes platessa]|uniref:Uncharacterized protein n=1 Tax=Pleuronectes platessa TaxID=8262 RepID=A0A9N7UAW8_PLEPL|nr:unnamed protein product [Pleuronectes platessa]
MLPVRGKGEKKLQSSCSSVTSPGLVVVEFCIRDSVEPCAQMLVEVFLQDIASLRGEREAVAAFRPWRDERREKPSALGRMEEEERQPSALGVMEEERDFRQTSPYIGPGDLTVYANPSIAMDRSTFETSQ